MWLLSSRGKSFDAVFTFSLWMLRYRSREKSFSAAFTFFFKTALYRSKEMFSKS